MKKLMIMIIITFGYSQRLDPIDITIQEFEKIVYSASRNSQKVFVEDFTGLQ